MGYLGRGAKVVCNKNRDQTAGGLDHAPPRLLRQLCDGNSHHEEDLRKKFHVGGFTVFFLVPEPNAEG